MKVGDIVCCDYHPGTLGVLLSEPRISSTSDNASLGVFSPDEHEVIDVFMPWGKEVHLIEDLEIISESTI